MATELALILVTAAITSALTLVAAWYLFHRYVKQMLASWIDEKADELGTELQGRVRKGVRQGIRDGLSDVSDNVVRRTAEGAAKTGFGMIEDSVNFWFGTGKKKPSD